MRALNAAGTLSRRARRLHIAAISLLALQLLVSLGSSPLVWGGLLLTAMAALKLRESRRAQDLQRTALAELIAVGLLAVLQPELGPSLLQGLTALVVLAALLMQEGGGRGSLRQALLRSLQLGLAALPLLVLLFLLLPRIGPLWSVPGAGAGRTGLNDALDPGSISQLVQDPSPALRISWLRGGVPPPDQRYWRVLVLDRFDGRRWSAAPPTPPDPRRRDVIPPPLAEQIWVAEPSPLAALAWPGRGRPSDPMLQVSADGVLVGPSPGGVRRRYGIGGLNDRPSWPARPPEPLDLAMPLQRNPQLEALGSSWRVLTPIARVQAAQQLFQRQGLRYTLTPPPLPQRAPLDGLLFDTRAGFCEHFASAFTALMRAAGVPARVVVGYQGGEWVPASAWGPGYLEVRQSDAHAWSEVWLQGAGWLRVDPTGWVAPDRLSGGVRGGLRGQSDDLRRLTRGLPLLRELERSWTRLDLAWNRWVVTFDASRQQNLLGRWRDWQGVLLLLGLAAALLPGVWLLQRPARGSRGDRLRRRLARVLAALRLRGLEPRPGESLGRFCERAGQTLPDQQAALEAIARGYEQLRFSGRTSGDPQATQRWEASCRELVHRLRRRGPGPVERADAHQLTPKP